MKRFRVVFNPNTCTPLEFEGSGVTWLNSGTTLVIQRGSDIVAVFPSEKVVAIYDISAKAEKAS